MTGKIIRAVDPEDLSQVIECVVMDKVRVVSHQRSIQVDAYLVRYRDPDEEWKPPYRTAIIHPDKILEIVTP